MKEIGIKEREKAMVNKYGKIIQFILVNGKIIKCMEKEKSCFRMEILMMENGLKIQQKDLVFVSI